MHDIRFIRDNPEAFDAAITRRGVEPVAAKIVALDEARRAAATAIQEAQSKRNAASKAIGQAMGQGDTEKAEALKAEVADIKQAMPALEEDDRRLGAELADFLARIPNLPASDVPDGEGEDANVEISAWGEKRTFDFTPQEHADIGPALGMDFETGAKLSGARFTFLRGGMARLHRALGQFMLDHQITANGYTECNPPLLVRDEAMYGTDKLPKFAEDSFQTFRIPPDTPTLNSVSDLSKIDFSDVGTDFVVSMSAFNEHNDFSDPDNIPSAWTVESDELRAIIPGHYLIPTAEVSLTASVQGDMLDEAAFPIRMTALTQCFRSEAGSAGKDTRGFIRQHQFEKCELVSIVRPEESEAEHERMTGCAEQILQALELPYRKMLLCTGDMGFGARKTYDLEVWLPGQGAYREISSCSNTGDFQARRMGTRFKPEGQKNTVFPHTLNGSGLAVGRTLVAIMENYQNADGSVTIPGVLKPYMGGIETLEPTA